MGNEFAALQYQLSTVIDWIKHEDNLINHRLGWLLAIQGVMFAGFALTIDKNVTVMAFALCIIGICSALSVRLICDVGSDTLAVLHDRRNILAKKMDEEVKLEAMYFSDNVKMRVRTKFPSLRPWKLLPVIFIVVWFFLGGYVTFLRLGYFN
jgi:hypothetical protein